MKTLVNAVASTVALVVASAVPVASFAQSGQPLTRAQVKAQLQQVEQAGYSPGKSDESNYPDDIQAAEARVATDQAMAHADTTGYGTTATGTTQTGGGAPAPAAGQ